MTAPITELPRAASGISGHPWTAIESAENNGWTVASMMVSVTTRAALSAARTHAIRVRTQPTPAVRRVAAVSGTRPVT